MRKAVITTTILLYCVLVFSQTSKDSRGYLVKVGDFAPDFSVELNNGETFQLSKHKGKIVMLQFTASWCGVCRKEMPFIEQEIHQQLKDKNFVLIGIDKDEPLEKVNTFVAQTAITYPLALDVNGKVFEKYAHPRAGITRNVIVDTNGKIVYLTRLFERNEFNEMKKVIFDLLN